MFNEESSLLYSLGIVASGSCIAIQRNTTKLVISKKTCPVFKIQNVLYTDIFLMFTLNKNRWFTIFGTNIFSEHLFGPITTQNVRSVTLELPSSKLCLPKAFVERLSKYADCIREH